jgi:hypothetical protein
MCRVRKGGRFPACLERIPVTLKHFSRVMAELVPAIRALLAEAQQKDVDARDKRGHDDGG